MSSDADANKSSTVWDSLMSSEGRLYDVYLYMFICVSTCPPAGFSVEDFASPGSGGNVVPVLHKCTKRDLTGMAVQI